MKKILKYIICVGVKFHEYFKIVIKVKITTSLLVVPLLNRRSCNSFSCILVNTSHRVMFYISLDQELNELQQYWTKNWVLRKLRHESDIKVKQRYLCFCKKWRFCDFWFGGSCYSVAYHFTLTSYFEMFHPSKDWKLDKL